jgi:hypothetical protein
VDRVYLAQRGYCLGATVLYVTRTADLMPDPRTVGCSGSPLEAKALRGLQDLILKRHAFGIVLLEPRFRGVLVGEYLEVVRVTDACLC